MKPTLEQVLAFAQSDLDAAKIPTPHDVALTLAAALLQAGRYGDDHGAAVARAWTLVIDFYGGQREYEADVRRRAGIAEHQAAATGKTLPAIVASAAEGDMSREEARAYVTGGETGSIGEAGGGLVSAVRMPMQQAQPGSETMDLTAVMAAQRARQQRIAEANAKTIAAKAVLEEAEHYLVAAKAGGDDEEIRSRQAAVDEAQQAFDAAAAEQSKAHED